ncbi:protein of unknown function [Shewanella benthica]|uniref:Uncharacterized protein n=1 Tax=Shewanella benthica TaxID=43661 RepID=A0A330LWU5_9GAMM|nr:protein of unknown function [Shewanella benthica]
MGLADEAITPARVHLNGSPLSGALDGFGSLGGDHDYGRRRW